MQTFIQKNLTVACPGRVPEPQPDPEPDPDPEPSPKPE